MDEQPERYIRLRDDTIEKVIAKANALCATEQVIHGAWYNRTPTHRLVTILPSLEEDYVAILEKL